MQYEKKRNQLLVKKTRKYLKKNRFLLLSKFKERIWLQKTNRDLYFTGCGFIQTVGNLHFTGCSFAQTVGNLHFTGCSFIQTDRNLRFSTENYKKLTEISVSPQRITKNRLRRAFLSLGIPIHQGKDQIFYFFEDFYWKIHKFLTFYIFIYIM